MVGGLPGIFVLPILIVLFGITILIHELGHFVLARLCGLVVDVFSIGFGPAIWSTRHKGILYKIGCIPFGGYVALPQLDPSGMKTIQGEDNASGQPNAGDADAGDEACHMLPAVAPWKKVVVAFCGAAGNVLLAIAIAWIVYWVGMPAGPAERSSVAGYVDSESDAYKQGLRTGDLIVSVNNVMVNRWSAFRMEAALCKSATLVAKTQTGEIKTITVPTEKGVMGEQAVAGVYGADLCVVLAVEPDMSASSAGIRNGDRIVKFADLHVFSRAHLIGLVDKFRDKTVPVVVKRVVGDEHVLVTLSVTPTIDNALGRARIGISFSSAAVEHDTIVHPLPSDQLRHHATAILRVLRALTSPKQARVASSAVGGPVAILISYWYIVKTSVMLAVWFTGLLNVNLAIINLLPIPVLDGGHIVFALWEMMTGKPVSEKIVNVLMNVFAAILIGLIVLLSIRDLDRMTPIGRSIRKLVSRNAPTAAASNAVGHADSPMPAGSETSALARDDGENTVTNDDTQERTE